MLSDVILADRVRQVATFVAAGKTVLEIFSVLPFQWVVNIVALLRCFIYVRNDIK